MSKRLNKRQQRELDELEALKAEQSKTAYKAVAEIEEDDEEDQGEQTGIVNPFAALEGGQDAETEDDEEEAQQVISTPKKNKKKKPKKKKTPAPVVVDEDAVDAGVVSKAAKASAKPYDGMDEVDRALAELKLNSQSPAAGSSSGSAPAASKSVLTIRNLLSVDPKNLDADAELRRFFGSKVIATGPKARVSKLRYTLSKPKPNYPPPTSLAGLGMRELAEEEVDDVYERRGWEQDDIGEKWFTYEHSMAWREVERQFLGAVRSHDPNELMALLQVYPWHVDTLLQMSEVYRLQSAASDYAERALYAFDRCLLPSFSVTAGTCRMDFDRVENRPMFTALHRIISYLGRRGCWVTAFNFAKLLFSLDPQVLSASVDVKGDPHGAAFWLDFLAVKSGHGAWLLSMLAQDNLATLSWKGYPGMAYARALALRTDEQREKATSTEALRQAIQTFPQVVLPMADKIGANLPSSARSDQLMQIEAGYIDNGSNTVHLLSHIYVARSEALWKDADNLKWFEETAKSTIPSLLSAPAAALRADAHAALQTPRDPVDESLATPLFICRHVLCSESTSFVGFLPPSITARPFHAYDPLPPTTALSQYDAEYFAGVQKRRHGRGAAGSGSDGGGVFDRFIQTVRGLANIDPAQWPDGMRLAFEQMAGGRDAGNVERGERAQIMQELVRMFETMTTDERLDGGGSGMPGAFPGAEGEDSEDE